MYDFSNGSALLNSLCDSFDFILLQEHWLLTTDLCKLDCFHKNFTSFSVSAMNDKTENGILVGRPYGGTAILCNNNLLKYISLIEVDQKSGRFVCLRYHNKLIDVIITNVYFPYYKTTSDYTIECCSMIANLEHIINEFPECQHIIAGDWNFSCSNNNPGFDLFKHVIDDYNLICCDNLGKHLNINYTYCHESLSQYSWLDHFFISKDLLNKNTLFDIIDSGANLSDHLPICLSLQFDRDSLTGETHDTTSLTTAKPMMRWDKADLHKYYQNTFSTLQQISVPSHLLNCSDCNCFNHTTLIDEYTNSIVNALKAADSNTIPRIMQKILKSYWNPDLDRLKQISIDLHNLWRSIGSPRNNSVINTERIRVKYEYKLAIQENKAITARIKADKINSSLAEKESSVFWKCWNTTYNSANKTRTPPIINNLSNHFDIVNSFRSYFNKIYENSSNDYNAVKEYTGLLLTTPSSSIAPDLIDICEIEDAVRQLSLNKTPDSDDLVSEHIIYSHPSILTHLKCLFMIIQKHGYVPNSFTSGLIIPIIKDKRGDQTSMSNYRPITISSVFSKIFEYFLLNKFSTYMSSDMLQFAYKPSMGCSNAIFLLRRVIQHFNDKFSNVYIASLDASKAFDRINHFKLFSTLIKKGLPKYFISTLVNWYSRLSIKVKWCNSLSLTLRVRSGVRQGGVLSGLFFNLYMNCMISSLRDSDQVVICMICL